MTAREVRENMASNLGRNNLDDGKERGRGAGELMNPMKVVVGGEKRLDHSCGGRTF
jgi:hypothetical protein